jgi:hypothetical protein
MASDDYLTTKQSAQLSGLSTSYLNKLRCLGAVARFSRLGGNVSTAATVRGLVSQAPTQFHLGIRHGGGLSLSTFILTRLFGPLPNCLRTPPCHSTKTRPHVSFPWWEQRAHRAR